jgi:hypothetical protein
MRLLIIDENLKAQLNSLREHAESKANIFTLADLHAIIDKKALPAGDRPEFTRVLPFGYRVVFSIEEHPLITDRSKYSKLRHLSMSVPAKNKLPNEFVIQEIMTLLGFWSKYADAYVFIQDDAVNVMEELKKTS